MQRALMSIAALGLFVAASAPAVAGTFTVSNPIYDLTVTYDFEGDRVRHEVTDLAGLRALLMP